MTTLPTVVGLLPMALAFGVGTEATRCVMFEERFPRRNDIAENEPASP